jgi:hypothetical protein
MSETSGANLELAIGLPLGVIANQLMKIEADLRFLNMKALAFAKQRDKGSLDSQVAARLEKINEALDLIRGLMADLQTDIQPASAPRASLRSGSPASHKPLPDRDD